MKRVNVLVCDTGISERHLGSVNIIDIGMGWKDDNKHGSQIMEINRSLFNKVCFTSMKILDREKSCSLDILLKALDIIADLDVDIICLALAIEEFCVSKEIAFCIESKINNIIKQGKIVISALHNERDRSYPAILKNVIGIKNLQNDKLFTLHRFYDSSKEIQCQLKCQPAICEGLDNQYSLFRGNSMATSFFLSHLSHLLLNKGSIPYVKLEEILDNQKEEDLYFYNNIKTDINDKVKITEERLGFVFKNYLPNIDLNNLLNSIHNIDELSIVLSKLKKVGYGINNKTVLRVSDLETIGSLARYLTMQGDV